MARAVRFAVGALAALATPLTTPSRAVAQAVSSPHAASASVAIEGRSDGNWTVVEALTLSADSLVPAGEVRPTFMYLAKPCSQVGSVDLVRGTRVVPLLATERGPWRMLSDTSSFGTPSAAGDSVLLQFHVRTEGAAVTIPLVVPTLPLPKGPEERSGTVRVSIALPDSRARVTYPRFRDGDSPHVSVGDFPALPSAVHVRLTSDAGPCAQSIPAGDDGGLTWRFWLLVAILVVWVPTYQWWARRQPEGAR